MSTFKQLADGISCHAWNKDRSMLCLCPNTNEVWIYSNCLDPDMTKWKKEHVLTEHDMVVSGLDWSPIHNMIVSCSHDRNAFVWKYDPRERKWKPELVLLRINRAATNVKWSPDGKKFAVSSGAKCVPVCYFEPHNNWWISKMIKKHKSTVLDLDWHPNSQLLVTGSSDMRCRVFSAYIADLDATPDPGPFKEIRPFGEVVAEYDTPRGWVESVAWSPNGKTIAFTGHDSSIQFIGYGASLETPKIQTLRLRCLPLQRTLFLDDLVVLGCGHDFNVHAFVSDATGTWAYAETLDKYEGSTTTSKSTSAGFAQSRNLWESKVVRGQGSAATLSDKDIIRTKHESTVSYIKPYNQSPSGTISAVTTSAADGRLVFWKINDLNLRMVQLKV